VNPVLADGTESKAKVVSVHSASAAALGSSAMRTRRKLHHTLYSPFWGNSYNVGLDTYITNKYIKHTYLKQYCIFSLQ
jgi:hypothetical protein